jgi:hypothetical protein
MATDWRVNEAARGVGPFQGGLFPRPDQRHGARSAGRLTEFDNTAVAFAASGIGPSAMGTGALEPISFLASDSKTLDTRAWMKVKVSDPPV